MPSAKVRMATRVKPGAFASTRTPYRKSCQRLFMRHLASEVVARDCRAKPRLEYVRPRKKVSAKIRADGISLIGSGLAPLLHAGGCLADQGGVAGGSFATWKHENIFKSDARVIPALRGLLDKRPRCGVQPVQQNWNRHRPGSKYRFHGSYSLQRGPHIRFHGLQQNTQTLRGQPAGHKNFRPAYV